MIWEIDEATPKVEGLDADGRAIPAYAASLGLRPAPFGRRFGATAVEVAIVAVLLLPLLVGAVPIMLAAAMSSASGVAALGGSDLIWVIVLGGASWLLTTVFIILQLILHGRRGVTAGKAMFGIRSVNVRTLERPRFWRGAVVRYLVMSVSFWVPLIGPLLVIALSPFFDTERRGRSWVDHAGATWLVDVRDGLNPYDAKRMRIARKTVATNLRDEKPSLPSLATPGAPGASTGYVPTSRSSGGVLGARRDDQPELPSMRDAAPAPAAPSPQQPAAQTSLAAPAAHAPAAPETAAIRAGSVPAFMAPAGSARQDGLISAVPGARPRTATVTLTLDTGEAVAVDGAGVLIGRAPAAGAGENGMGLLNLTDDGKSVSKTHLALFRSGTALTVVDRGSTNGSAVIRRGDERILLPGESVEVFGGDTIRFGDRTATVRID